MGIFSMFGIGTQNIIAAGHKTTGTVAKVTTCYWLKVNQKPLRTSPLDGAAFPHMVHFTYKVNGTAYRGRRFLNWTLPCPHRGETLTVCYDPQHPASYAVDLS